MAEIKKYKVIRAQCKAALTRLESFVNDQNLLSDATIEILEARKEKLLSVYKEYETVQFEILELDENDSEDIGFVENKYFSILAAINKTIKALRRSEGSFQNNVSITNLPDIDLPKYDGKDFTKFRPFYELFLAVIDSNQSLPDIAKLCYLRKYLLDDALSIIVNLPLENRSYKEALQLLKKRFDNKARLISNHVSLILDIQSMQKGTAASIRLFISQLQQQLYALKNLEQPIDKWDMLLIPILIRKLDIVTSRAYQLDRDSDKLPTVSEFIDFLEKRAIALEDSLPIKCSSNEGARFKPNLYKVSNVAAKQYCCNFCNKSEHDLHNCLTFKMSPIEARLKYVKDKKLCLVCLKSHQSKCKLNFKCKSCKGSHNTLLHNEEVQELPMSLLTSYVPAKVMLPTIKVKIFNVNGQEIYVKALLDSGSQASFVTTALVKYLGLTPVPESKNIIGIANKPTKINQCVPLTISSNIYDIKYEVNCHVVSSITSKLPQHYINVSKWQLPKSIELADSEFNMPSEISILLGADIYFESLLDGCIKLPNGPVLQNTTFGYVLGGNVPSYKCNNITINKCVNVVTNLAVSDHDMLENVMEQFWLSEKVPDTVQKVSDEFHQAEKIFKKCMKFINNRFYVDLPLVKPLDQLQLGDSFSVALQRFYSLEKRFKNNPDFFHKYRTFIQDYIDLGHAREVEIDKYDINNGPVYFLAHHAVCNEASKTTKLRVVFDGSMQSRNKISLNDVMLNGPVVQSELFNILILFRTYLFTLMCDIEKAFRQVHINEPHKSLQNILWRDNPKKPIVCLQLQTVTYGLKASTFLTTRCLVELANRHKDKYPMAAHAMLCNTYVDDVITGSNSLEELSELKRQLIELLKLGNFQLHKWCSNQLDILKSIPSEHRYFEDIDLNKTSVIKTLGLKYNIFSDMLTFTCHSVSIDKCNTKRKILSFIGRMFDPLGLISPIIVVAKLIMQSIWAANLPWDSILPQNILNEWIKFLTNLKVMNQITVPRGINIVNFTVVELVGYCDASFKAFGCCLYLRFISDTGVVKTQLLCSKSRIAPLSKALTIPQLELNSALLLAQLACGVNKVLLSRYSNIKVFLYSDSQIVLAWINCKRGNNIYVNNRVKQIVELSKDFLWAYVRSADNPADLISRGCDPQMLGSKGQWWCGPGYLIDKNYLHVPAIGKYVSEVEMEIPCLHNKVNNFDLTLDFFKNYSNLNKLQSVVGYIYRFYNNSLHNKNNKNLSPHLTPLELDTSLLIIVRCLQRSYFNKEIEVLLAGKSLKSGILNLHPFIDKFGILRVGGRLNNAKGLHYNKIHPIILPKNSHITKLLIEREHLRLLHAGPRLVLSSLSQKFWIVSGLREVKKVLHKCVRCFRLKAEAAQQLMGSLPPERIIAAKPFQHVGIDFCGPFQIKVSRIRKPLITKGYVALFVCFVTKAIHVELASDLTTETFLACLKRFISRRGMPTKIFCDNAKTFKGACNQLNELYELQKSKCHRDAVNNYCSNNYIHFNFIPSYSPQFGGLWEAGVKSLKYHMKRVIGNLNLTYEQFNTVIIQIEGILNSRPLIAQSSDNIDVNYLTPGHFLVGSALTSYPEVEFTERSISHLKFWNIVTKIKQDFWKSWSRDYLTQLQSRPKWKNVTVNLKVGDVVLVKNLNTSPLDWPIGMIIKTIPGQDGKVRVAEVRIGNKTYIRSIVKLCPLPIS